MMIEHVASIRHRVSFSSILAVITLAFFLAIAVSNPSLQAQATTQSTAQSTQQPTAQPIVILNEGNFNRGNASLTVWNPDEKRIRNNVFSTVNGLALGDVAQSAAMRGNNRLYVVMNNSDLIQIVDAESFSLVGQIPFQTGSSPREISSATSATSTDSAPDLAIVTHLYDNSVSLIDLQTNKIYSQRIKVGSNPDKILSHNGRWFVANWGFGSDSTLMVIAAQQGKPSDDPSNYVVIDTLYAGRGPREMVVDANERLWVLCEGYTAYDESFNVIEKDSRPGGLFGFDMQTGEQIHSVQLSTTGEDLLYDPVLDRLYFLSGGVRVFDLGSLSLQQDPLVNGSFYSLGLNSDGSILLSSAGDYVSAGDVFLYSPEGDLLSEARAGIIPGHFVRMPFEATPTTVESFNRWNELPIGMHLGDAYPNPFNPETSIPLWLGADSRVGVRIYDMMGRMVQHVYAGHLDRGWHTFRVNAESWPAGAYVIRLNSGGKVLSKRVTLVK